MTHRVGIHATSIVFLILTWLGGSDAAPAAEYRLNGHTFALPDGFEIELVAKSPLVDRPVTAAFDELGRLYVADSAGVNDPVARQLEEKPHRVVRLEDADGDGVFDTSVVFADKLMFPEGTLFHAGSLYVAAPPSIWKLTDLDGDGIADQREEWFQGKTLTGCANDLHGPYLGPDGYIYWCKGAFAEQNYTIRGKPFQTKASHIFRCRPDGSDLESVMTGGMDNPVDVVFLPDGERIFTTTFLVHPGNGLRDGLLHAVYGGVYGKDWNTLDGHPRTGEVMPVLSHLGAAAPCGLECYQSIVFGDEFYGNLFACQFNMHKVSRHVLTPKGATYDSADSDFVVSDNSDFHPTDVLEDADGSLIVVDTGGWYKLCCPTSQLHKPDILGAIYRVRKAGTRKVADPRGLTIDWAKQSASQLLKLALDPRPAVRRRAADVLQRHADSDELRTLLTRSIQDFENTISRSEPLKVPHSAANLMGATSQLWAIDRLGTQQARSFVRRLLKSENPQVRQAALHAVSLHRDAKAKPELLELLKTGTPGNRRVAAEALGRIGDKSIIPDLLHAAADAEDRFLEHSITYALIELEDSAALEQGIRSENARVRRAALIALDQMPGRGLTPKQVIPLLASANEIDLDTANWLLQRHPEWGNDVAGWFAEQLASLPQETTKVSEARSARLESQLATFTGAETIRQLLAATAGDDQLPLAARKLALRVMAKANVSELPPLWAETLTKLLVGDCPVVGDAVAVARSLPGTKDPPGGMIAALRELASRPDQELATRLDALAAIPTGLKDVSDDEFALIVDGLRPDNPVTLRAASADILAKATLAEDQLLEICDVVRTVGPLELDRVLGAFAQSTSEAAGRKLLAMLKEAASLTSLRIDSLRQRLAKYSPAVQEGIDDLEKLVNVDAATQRARIEDLLARVTSGDVRRGQAIFNSSKAACLACHKFGYVGGLTGPDLTRIGAVRQERDLLESILYPSLSFVRSYEPMVISTVDGKVVNGLIRNETADEIVLATGPNKEERVRKADVDEIRPSTVSIMPAGLDKQLSEQDLLDLVAFLKNAK
jgi:putative membrane-bound dehydrogenase-like protein